MEATHGADAAILQAAIELSDAETATERASFYAYARRGRPEAIAQVSRAVEVRHRGQAYRIVVSQLAPGRYRLEVDGKAVEAGVERLVQPRAPHHLRRPHAPRADLAPGRGPARRGPRRPAPDHPRRRRLRALARPVGRGRHPVSRGRRGGRGRRRRGRRVDEDGDVAHRAVRGPRAPRALGTNVQVPAHTPLLQLEAIEDEAAEQAAERVTFAAGEAASEDSTSRSTACAGCCSATTSAATRSRRALRSCAPARPTLPGRAPPARLSTPTCARSPAPATTTPSASSCTPRRSTCTRSCAASTPRPSDCPSASSSLLGRALAHYGVEGLDRTPALEEACYRLFVAQSAPTSAAPR